MPVIINDTNGDWYWPYDTSYGKCPEPSVWFEPKERLTNLLDMDGNPLTVGLQRPKIGFDLTPKKG